MNLTTFNHTGRPPHFWLIRLARLRELLLANGWRIHRTYAVKTIRGREFAMTIAEGRTAAEGRAAAEARGGSVYCRFQLKSDFLIDLAIYEASRARVH